jgi:branched-chain amino acid transport system permease protein
MAQILLFAVLGLGSGAFIAGIATGLVVMYRGSGIINLAMGAQAMVAGYAFWGFTSGEFGFTVGKWLAIPLALVVALVLGALMEVLAFRRLRTAAPVAKLVASLGILLFLAAGFTLWFGPQPVNEPSILPGGNISVVGVGVPESGLIVAGAAVAVAIVLTVLYRFTRFGLATRATAESEVSGVLAGLSPNGLAMMNTLLASLVVGILGVLAGSLTSLDPTTVPLLVIPALAAALFARFTSAITACLIGLGVGVVENLVYYASVQTWFPKDQGTPLPGLNQLIEFLLVVIALFAMGSRLPGRSAITEKRLPSVPLPERFMRPAIICGIVTVVALIFLPYGWREALLTSQVAIVLMLSIVVITGYVGQISIVQLPLAGIAGFTMAHVSEGWHLGFPVAALLGVGAATLIGLFIGASALRVRGVQLAVVSLAAAVAIEQFWFTNTVWGESNNGNPVADPKIFGLSLGAHASFRGIDGQIPSPMLGIFFVVIMIVVGLFVANLRRTNLGQQMLAVRANERAAAGAGISVRNVKLMAFGISSVIAGISGVMAAFNYSSVSANNYDALSSLSIVAFAYVGGITTITGAIAGGLITTEALVPYVFQTYLHISGSWALLVGGFFLVFNLIFAPNGVGLGTRRDVGRLGHLIKRLVLREGSLAATATATGPPGTSPVANGPAPAGTSEASR